MHRHKIIGQKLVLGQSGNKSLLFNNCLNKWTLFTCFMRRHRTFVNIQKTFTLLLKWNNNELINAQSKFILIYFIKKICKTAKDFYFILNP